MWASRFSALLAFQRSKSLFNALGYLLKRNGKPFVGWQMCVGNNGNVGFAVNYFALAAGLRPEVFKLICETMIQEVHEFDAKMDKAGLLR